MMDGNRNRKMPRRRQIQQILFHRVKPPQNIKQQLTAASKALRVELRNDEKKKKKKHAKYYVDVHV